MASNLATFRALLAKRVDDKLPIPNVVLKDNSDLGHAFARVVTVENPKSDETAGQTVGRYLDEICASLEKDENKEAVEMFDETAAAFTMKVKNAWSAVDGVRETARQMATDMEKITSDQLNADAFVSKHASYNRLSEDFPTFEWNGTKVMGSMSDVITRVNGLMTAKDAQVSSEIDRSLFNIIISDMSKYGKLEDVEINEETRKAAIEALSGICQTSTAGDIEAAVDMLTGINKVCPIWTRLDQLKNLGQAQVMMFKNITDFDAFITSFYPIMELVTSDQVTPIPTAKEGVIENAKKIITLCDIACYYEYMQRTTIYRESCLLPGGIINADTKEDFTSSGGTMEMLAQFVRFMYKDDKSKIPVMGIKAKPIVDGSAKVAELVRKDIASVEGRVALARNNARTAAFRIVSRDYISKKVKHNNPDATGTEIASSVEDLMAIKIRPIVESVRQYNVNFMDAAMNAIVAVEYQGTFVEHLFKELGAAYISATEANGNVTAEDIRQADVSVIAKLISNFLVDKLVDVLPEGATGVSVNA